MPTKKSIYLEKTLKEKTNNQKLGLIYRVSERLRLEYNIKGKEFRDNIITKDEWNIYKTSFRKKQKFILMELKQANKPNFPSGTSEEEKAERLRLMQEKDKMKQSTVFDNEIDLTKI